MAADDAAADGAALYTVPFEGQQTFYIGAARAAGAAAAYSMPSQEEHEMYIGPGAAGAAAAYSMPSQIQHEMYIGPDECEAAATYSEFSDYQAGPDDADVSRGGGGDAAIYCVPAEEQHELQNAGGSAGFSKPSARAAASSSGARSASQPAMPKNASFNVGLPPPLPTDPDDEYEDDEDVDYHDNVGLGCADGDHVDYHSSAGGTANMYSTPPEAEFQSHVGLVGTAALHPITCMSVAGYTNPSAVTTASNSNA
jgi:hypothetical protein